ncbi:unnamed protein product [Ambrosiozyma monospora]|uniref:Unnamed protein product n=1 Tax=Ambrosiozyma monospora TaxID=43982 RepID=A0ACB5TTQ3_AMBMO|nr:unnamed protein product [Ambrosiozyma monospora]
MGATIKDSKEPVLNVNHLGKTLPSLNSTSTGLHHDHADNLYLPISGEKRFTLFSPEQAINLYTVGKLNRLFDTGIIDYVKDHETAPFWKSVRNDGAILKEVERWELLKQNGEVDESKFNDTDSIDEAEAFASNGEKKDPPSFSKIPPSLIHLDEIKDEELLKKMKQLIIEKYPNLLKATSTSVHLKPRQLLYLPAGWFHEVTSYGNLKDHVHTAVNYWFAPPNKLDDYENPYQDSYWRDDFQRTKLSLKYFNEHPEKLF